MLQLLTPDHSNPARRTCPVGKLTGDKDAGTAASVSAALDLEQHWVGWLATSVGAKGVAAGAVPVALHCDKRHTYDM